MANKKERMELLNKYKKPDGIVYLPAGITLNDHWRVINGFNRGTTFKELIDDIEEEIQEELEVKRS